ncbi:MAG TPA: alkaline phosphatase family protein, partial [Actinomycetota bacterium]
GADPAAAPGIRAAAGDAAWAAEVCDAVPTEWLQRVDNAFRTDWSGDVQYLPNYPNPVDGGLSHAGPWPHLQEVPFLIYGPGYVKPGVYEQPVSVTDIAPTAGRLVDFDFAAPDGEALTDALVPADDRPLPKLVVTLIWDSAGTDVLDRWEGDWPYLEQLASEGAWFPDATVGISNSNTPPGHAAIGTGAFPVRSGVIDEYVRLGDHMVQTGEGGPSFVLLPTFGDLYDLSMGNEPIVGSVVTLASHAFMMSHGAMWNGGDRDITVMRQELSAETSGVESVEWNLPGKMRLYYSFPEYANRASQIDGFNRELDQRDGQLDGLWRQNSIEQLRSGFDTPARTPYQTQLIRAVVERERFGRDEVPDLLYLNYKAIDTIGHAYGMDSVEMQDSIQYQDEALRDVVEILNEEVGEGEWVLFLTADHGAQIPADVTDSIPIDPNKMKKLVADRFDTDGDAQPLFRQIRPTQLWVDQDELEDLGVTFDEIARYIGSLTATQVARSDFTIPSGREDELVYQASWPSRLMPQLPCLAAGDES